MHARAHTHAHAHTDTAPPPPHTHAQMLMHERKNLGTLRSKATEWIEHQEELKREEFYQR